MKEVPSVKFLLFEKIDYYENYLRYSFEMFKESLSRVKCKIKCPFCESTSDEKDIKITMRDNSPFKIFFYCCNSLALIGEKPNISMEIYDIDENEFRLENKYLYNDLLYYNGTHDFYVDPHIVEIQLSKIIKISPKFMEKYEFDCYKLLENDPLFSPYCKDVQGVILKYLKIELPYKILVEFYNICHILNKDEFDNIPKSIRNIVKNGYIKKKENIIKNMGFVLKSKKVVGSKKVWFSVNDYKLNLSCGSRLYQYLNVGLETTNIFGKTIESFEY